MGCMNDEPNAGRDSIFMAGANPAPASAASHSHNGAAGLNAAEVLPLAEAVWRHWYWLFIGGAALGILGFAAGLLFWKTSYTAPAQLIRYDSPNAEQVFGARQAAPATLPSILHSPELLQRVGAKADPPVPADILNNGGTGEPLRAGSGPLHAGHAGEGRQRNHPIRHGTTRANRI
jgi:hypothetical protein